MKCSVYSLLFQLKGLFVIPRGKRSMKCEPALYTNKRRYTSSNVGRTGMPFCAKYRLRSAIGISPK